MQVKTTYGLERLIKSEGVEFIQQMLLSDFACRRNPDIERFLHKSAVRFEQARVARSYLILDDNSEILAYFTLSFKSIFVQGSKSQLKKLTGGLTNDNKINVFLVGQLGKNSLVENNPIQLSDILSVVFEQIAIAQKIVGGRAIILECDDNPKLIQLYQQNGFQLLDTVEDDHKLKTLFIIPKLS